MPQFARPSIDTTRDNWEADDGSTTNIFGRIDEVVANDADYIRTQITPTNDVYVAKATAVPDPARSDAHILRYRYGKDIPGGMRVDITVELREGYVSEVSQGTLIATQAHTDVAVFPLAGSFSLTGTEADGITDYGNLYFRFVGNQV